MFLHLCAIIVVAILVSLFIFYDTILEWMDSLYTRFIEKKEEKKDLKKHQGMYDFYHEE